NDEQGIVWPVSVAPYELEIVPLNVNDDLVWPEALKIADELSQAGLELIVDDRDERAGVKFADADLYGFPYQVILGKRGVANGNAEVKRRADGERFSVPFAELAAFLLERIVPSRA
ncbi:MAG TPA: His/Gly/Thr/Pro-type tRNA ligase C-terminal domain-containing protein, partial [Atopobiaceae bacterium]|nr:His/Gly/Thr/Pro-type tRNA ligase C-terminal domain-containing protein [Atopobiaceae bacterium]